MLYFTVIVRDGDCLALTADTESTSPDLERNKVTSKNLLRKLVNHQVRSQGNYITVEASQYHYHVLIDQGVLFLTMCESNANANVAFAYLEDVAQEFLAQYGPQVATVSRPYPFIKFDLYLQKTKKVFMGGRGDFVKPGRPPVIKKQFRDIMGYAEQGGGSKKAGGGGDDNTTMIIIGGVGVAIFILLIIIFFVLM